MNQDNLYPVVLNLKKKKCTIVGGGEVAFRKARRLLRCGAKVIVISPALSPKLQKMKQKEQIIHLPREYRRGDVKGSFLVMGATGKESVNKEVAKEARTYGSLVNIVDSPSLCDFFVPSLLRRGNLTLSISTEGRSPALAKKIKEDLRKRYGEEYRVFLNWMGEARKAILEKVKDRNRRKIIFHHLTNSKTLNLLRQGKREEARRYFLNCIKNTIINERKC